MSDVPKSHPRYLSLKTREDIVSGVENGITSMHGLIAQGRGEAFDYLIGEKTNTFAEKAIDCAVAMIILAKKPVISVNGNVAALVAAEIVKLSKESGALIEVNIFHTSKKREDHIKKALKENGAKKILMPSKDYKIKHIDHNRKFVNKNGIYKADLVFVPLEDGDRCSALVKNKKKVITVDLNPMSRTSKSATVTIVDNITRVLPLMNIKIKEFKRYDKEKLKRIVARYNNDRILRAAKRKIKTI